MGQASKGKNFSLELHFDSCSPDLIFYQGKRRSIPRFSCQASDVSLPDLRECVRLMPGIDCANLRNVEETMPDCTPHLLVFFRA